MDQEAKQAFDEQNKKLDAIYRSAEKTRKYFKWTLIISIAVIVLPLIGLIFAIPAFLKTINPAQLLNF
jgi:type IV secretory pathway component VirB8